MPLPNITTNFKFSDGTDLGERLITKNYLISVYPELFSNLFTSNLWGWGYGQPWSMGSNTSYSTPITLSDGLNWKQVSCTHWGVYDGHAAAIKSDGTLWTVGRNSYGELGLGIFDTTERTSFTKVGTDTDWAYVKCGPFNTAAIKKDGSLWTWGRNVERQLGLGDATVRRVPTRVGLFNVRDVAISDSSMSAITQDGGLWSWGTNRSGILGLNIEFSTDYRSYPTAVSTGNRFLSLDMNSDYAYAVTETGSIYRWGRLSPQGGISFQDYPILYFGSDDFKSVACGYSHAAAIKKDGTLLTIGNNSYGGLGNGTTTSSSFFIQVPGIWKQVSCGNYMTAAIRTDGSLWTWGNNQDRQLGQNISTSFTSTPAQIFGGGYNWKNIVCAPFGMYGIKSYEY